MSNAFLLFILILIASIFAPQAMLILLAINLAIGLFLSFFQLSIALLPHSKPRSRPLKEEPLVSILVPTFNEPPAILMQTLEGLRNLHYDNFEVMTIDNNTEDEHIWKPIKTFSETLGEKFKFFHVNPLSGFKAGALNYLLERMNPKSEYIAIVDADYLVKPEFIATALSYFSDEKIALVQFPQHYRNCEESNRPIADEYKHFFNIYMNMANYMDCVPSTGTVSLYRASVLKEIGGFRMSALTEDADAGLRIYGAGYRGVYVDKIIGTGLMPYDIEAYKHQKRRWAFGNIQSLKVLLSMFGKIPFNSWFGFLLHLTAWHHMNFLPFAVIAAYVVIISPFIQETNTHLFLFEIASINIFSILISKFIIFYISLKGRKKRLSRSWHAFLIHTGMTLNYSEAFLTILFPAKMTFERTNKFILDQKPNLLKNTYKELILGAWFIVGIIEVLIFKNETTAIATFFVSSFALLSIYYVHWRIYPTKEYSKVVLAEVVEKYKPYMLK